MPEASSHSGVIAEQPRRCLQEPSGNGHSHLRVSPAFHHCARGARATTVLALSSETERARRWTSRPGPQDHQTAPINTVRLRRLDVWSGSSEGLTEEGEGRKASRAISFAEVAAREQRQWCEATEATVALKEAPCTDG